MKEAQVAGSFHLTSTKLQTYEDAPSGIYSGDTTYPFSCLLSSQDLLPDTLLEQLVNIVPFFNSSVLALR